MIKRILFQGGAWAMIGEMGALKAIQKEMKKQNSIISPNVKLYGYSAGALILLLYACEYTDVEMFELYERFADIASTNIIEEKTICVTKFHLESFEVMFKKCPEAYKNMNKIRAHVGISCRDSGFKFIDRFNSNKHLAETLLASYNLPIICSYNTKYESEPCLDGGISFDYSKFLIHPIHEYLVVTATNIARGPSNININIPIIFTVIPPLFYLRWMYYNKGYEMTKMYLNKRDITIINNNNTRNVNPLLETILWKASSLIKPDYDSNDLNRYIQSI